MSMLSERQRDELHKSILDYLHTQNLSKAYDALLSETGSDFTPDPRAKYSGLLEKKWTSVIRLQKKIMDLENRNAALQEELTAAPTRRSASMTDWVPRAPPRHTLTGHRMPVTRVAFHPLYSQLVSASEDATIKIWDWETGEFERTLKGHTKAVQDVEFDSKGILLVSCSSDLTIKIWDTNNEHKNTKTLYGHDHSVSSSRFMPGDDFIISASRDKTIKVWEVASGYCVKTFQGHAEWVRCVLPSDDGKLLASCSNDHTARVWDSQSGETKMELRGHANVVEVAVFAPVAAYSAIRELAGIANERGKTIGTYLATGSRDKAIKLWDTLSGQCLKHFAGHDNWIRALVFHPSGSFLLSASDDKTIRIWDLKTGRCTKTIEAHGHFVTCFAWGRAAIAGGSGATNGAESASAGQGKEGAENSRKVNVCATGSVDQSVKVWTP